MSAPSPFLLVALLVLVLGGVLLWRWRARAVARAAALAAEPLEHPVVLVHGLLGFSSLGLRRFRVGYFRGLLRGLQRRGVAVYAPALPPLGSVPERAAQLAAFVRALPHQRVVLLGHSLGGLDARYAVSKLGLADRVVCVVTVGTPHRGTPLADFATTRPARLARRLARLGGLRTDALDWLAPERLDAFNREVPDVPGVSYYSVVGRATRLDATTHPLLVPLHAYLRARAGENDGLVPVSSQRWGEEIEVHASHWAQTGWSVRFRAGRFYRDLFARIQRDLARKPRRVRRGRFGRRRPATAAPEPPRVRAATRP